MEVNGGVSKIRNQVKVFLEYNPVINAEFQLIGRVYYFNSQTKETTWNKVAFA